MTIHTLDLYHQGTPHAIAAYLVIGDAPVLVETGPGKTLPKLLEGLAAHGVSPDEIEHVLVTHIHFDHAGAAGWWARQGAQVYVHHVGARHLIDPSRLVASATRIYGDQMGTLWGELIPAPAEKVTSLYDGDVVEVAGLAFQAIDTPGHARHHHVFRLGTVAFLGDAGGARLPGSPFTNVPAPPPEFDLVVWQQTVDRLIDEQFSVVYPTHFGRVADVADYLPDFKQRMTDAAHFIRDQMQAGVDRDDIVSRYAAWTWAQAASAGMPAEVLEQHKVANPLYMSVDGMMRYWRKQGE